MTSADRIVDRCTIYVEELESIIMDYVRKRIRDRQAAEDVAQKILLLFFRKCCDFQAQFDRSATAFVKYIARLEVIDFYRSNRRKRVVSDSTLIPDIPDDKADDLAERQLAEILPTLSEEHRRVLLLILEGLTLKAVAEKLDLSVDTVRKRRNEAFAIIKSKWGSA